MAPKVIAGGCHCGNISYRLGWPADEDSVGARACGCTFCQKHGGRWTSHTDASLSVAFSDPGAIQRYRFGTKTADFLICARCGVPPLVVSNIDGVDYAVVNVNTFEQGHGLDIVDSSTDFDGEDNDARLARRARNWMAVVFDLAD